MSSSELDPRMTPKALENSDARLLPPFSNIAEDAVLGLQGASDRFTEIVELANRTHDSEEVTISQELVDSISSKILFAVDPAEASEMAEIFDGLSQNTRRIKNGKRCNLFHDSVAAMSLDASRRDSRLVRGPHVTKGVRLINFINSLDENSSNPSRENIQAINSAVVKPTLELVNSTPKPEKLGSHTLQELDELIRVSRKVEERIDLSKLRLSCFLAILDCVREPNIELMLKTLYSAQDVKRLEAQGLFPMYAASGIIADLEDKDVAVRYRDPDALVQRNPYISKIPFIKTRAQRSYEETCDRLQKACYAYLDMREAQDWLREITAKGAGFEDMRESGVVVISGRTALRASGIVTDARSKLSEARDQIIAKDTQEESSVEHAWKQSIKAESLISDQAQELVDHVTRLRLKLDREAKTALRATVNKPIQVEFDQHQRERQQASIRPLIEKLTQDLTSIDQQYTLSGKKLRERDPRLIHLAKELSESLSITDHEPLDQDTARGLAGLMLGVYGERTGEKQPLNVTIQKYLDDANELRSLSSRLEELGQSTSSTLLRSINLLDEMIDSGIFDNIEDHPEFEELKEFIFSYICIRNTKPQGEMEIDKVAEVPEPTAADVEEPAEEKPTTLSTLPIEVIGEAEDEDIYVFPPGASWREVVSEFSQHIDTDDRYTVQWDRIIKLVELRDHCQKQGLEIDFIRTKHASWQKLPFFVLEVKMPGSTQAIAVVESPVYGNATYIFRESEDRLEWRDAVQLTRQEARELGAVPAVHVDDKRLDLHKEKLWDRIISELTVFK